MTAEIRNASIQQINIAYNPVEDRLLLKIGFSDDVELAVWLTRRLVKSLWQLLQMDEAVQGLVASDSITGGQVIQTADKPVGLQKLDFTSEYKPRQTINQHEILLARDCHLLKTASRQTSLELVCSNGQTIKLMLTQELTLALINMLQLVSKETAWELTMGLHAPVMSAIQTSTALH
ncbi:MAG: hypothetical protein CVU15_02265 [Betaproteobacteria bacterium HGW-Betaproteobacteria-1]|jgi:hypothetical protein|nr:MAG: hypothetical protein CVU15_02265 [Betaproteobacteria bacterium HGW-Betaproteobacteria-1]